MKSGNAASLFEEMLFLGNLPGDLLDLFRKFPEALRIPSGHTGLLQVRLSPPEVPEAAPIVHHSADSGSLQQV